MRPRLPRPLLLALLPLATWTGAAACGGNVIVDGATGNGAAATGASDTGASGTGASATGASGTGASGTGASGPGASGTGGTGTGTDTGIQVPTGGSAVCQQDYLQIVGNLQSALGCTPTANIPQCTGSALLPDPCGCMHVVNEAHPDLIQWGQTFWSGCVSAGCCGPQAGVGCSPCPPAPTFGVCDMTTSQCLSQ